MATGYQSDNGPAKSQAGETEGIETSAGSGSRELLRVAELLHESVGRLERMFNEKEVQRRRRQKVGVMGRLTQEGRRTLDDLQRRVSILEQLRETDREVLGAVQRLGGQVDRDAVVSLLGVHLRRWEARQACLVLQGSELDELKSELLRFAVELLGSVRLATWAGAGDPCEPVEPVEPKKGEPVKPISSSSTNGFQLY